MIKILSLLLFLFSPLFSYGGGQLSRMDSRESFSRKETVRKNRRQRIQWTGYQKRIIQECYDEEMQAWLLGGIEPERIRKEREKLEEEEFEKELQQGIQDLVQERWKRERAKFKKRPWER